MSSFVRRQALKLYDLATRRHVVRCMDELNRTQWLPREELLALQQTKLQRLLAHAYQHVPYYRRLFDEAGFQPTASTVDLVAFARVPTLSKALITANFEALKSQVPGYDKKMSKLTTGGSTGRPLIFMQDNNFRDYVTANIQRHLTWGGHQLGEPQAYIWGANFEVTTSQSRRTRLMDTLFNRFLTNAYLLSEERLKLFAEKIRQKRPSLLYGYPSAIYRFAEFVREQGMNDIKFDSMFSSAEVLYPQQRELIEATFGGKMFNRYGTRELGGVACECNAHTSLHVSVEEVFVEILDDNGQPVQPGQAGNIVVTNLNNYGMPFIRYRVEDMGSWSPQQSCPCGRALPLLDLTQGRRIDLFKTRDRGLVWGGFASPLFGLPGLKQFQLVQKSLDEVVVRIVKEGDLNETGMATIERTIHLALGDHVQINYEYLNEIPVVASGKYRYVISELN